MRKLLIPLFALVSLLGCPEPPPPPPVPTPVPTPQYFSHTVTYQGENLGKIAKWYTGAVDNWKLIASANPKLNPKKLRKGDVVNIPSNIIENSEPMPKKYIIPVTRPARRKAETFVVEENDVQHSSPPASATKVPVITGPTVPAVIEQVPVATPAPTSVPEIPTPVPVVIAEPTKPPAVAVQPTTAPAANAPSDAAKPDGEKSMEDLVAEEKRVLEQLQKEFQGGDSLAPH